MKFLFIPPGLVVVLSGITAALHVGKLPPALPILREALDITLLQAGFLVSLVQLAGMSLGLLVGLSADSLGLKRSMTFGLGILLVPIERLNRTLALWSCYMGLGIGSALLLGPWMIDWLGWQGWWWVLAGWTAIMLAWRLGQARHDYPAQSAGVTAR